MPYPNGRLPASALAPIGGGFHLERTAAAAFNAMNAHTGERIHVRDAYRILGAPGDYARGRWSQWYAWEHYERGGNLAARPGESNHGWGLAIDVVLPDSRTLIDEVGREYGFSKECSDAQSEAWHIKFNPVCTGAHYHPRTDANPLRQGSAGTNVRHLQRGLHDLGARWLPVDGSFGHGTHIAVVRFQRRRHLPADGIVGPATWRAIHHDLHHR